MLLVPGRGFPVRRRPHEDKGGAVSKKKNPVGGQRGWVSVEMAFAALGIGLAIVLGIGVFNLCVAQIRCGDAAAQIARQAARDDLAGVEQVQARLPEAAQVSIRQEGEEVVVEVSWLVRPVDWLPGLTVHSRACVVHEEGAR